MDDPDGEVNNFQASLRETVALTRELEGWNVSGSSKSPNSRKSMMNGTSVNAPPGTPKSSAGTGAVKTSQELIEVLKKREVRLYRAEDVLSKFLEVH